MATFPALNYLSNAARTQGEMKTAFEAWLAKCKQLLGGSVLTEFTISSGSITPTVAVFKVDTQSDAASDDLANIVTTHHDDGSIIEFRNENSGRLVTVKHAAGGAGQINLRNAADVILSGTTQWLRLIRIGADWFELSLTPLAATTAIVGLSRFATVGETDSLSSTTLAINPAGLAKHSPLGIRKMDVPASAWEAATTNGATLSKIETTTNAVGVGTCWDFSSSSMKHIWFKFKIPKGVTVTNFKFKVSWTAASGSGGVAWQCQALARSDDDPLDTAYGTAVVVTDTLITANDLHVTTLSGVVTPSGTAASEDTFYIRLSRDPAHASDTLGVDARFLGAELEWTQNKGNDA
jgi:hypothetical protein